MEKLRVPRYKVWLLPIENSKRKAGCLEVQAWLRGTTYSHALSGPRVLLLKPALLCMQGINT